MKGTAYLELAEYLRLLRAHWLGVVLIVVACVGGAAVFSATQPKVYEANANGFVSTGGSDDPALGSVNDELAKSRATSYVDIAKSRATAQQVIDALDIDADPAGLVSRITVEQPADTVLIKITARAGTPAQAQELADAWVAALAAQVKSIEDPSGRLSDGIPRVIPVEAAELPSSPVSPRPVRNLLLGTALGGLLGLGYAVTRNALNRRLRDSEDIESRFQVAVVGAIPSSRVLHHPPGSRAYMAVDPDGPAQGHAAAAEAFRKLRTNLMYMDIDSPPRVIVVTSPKQGDGKSTVAANLAVAIDATGQNTVLVDGDLRRPSVATSFGLVEGVGLTDVLAGRVSLDDAFQTPVGHRDLKILAAGALPPNPSELLGTKTMQALMRKLAADAFVILDAPPLLPVTDAAILAASADGAFVVISAGKTFDTDLRASLDHLEAVNGRALGVVINRVTGRRTYDYDYDYDAARGVARGRRRRSKPETEQAVLANRRR